MRHTFFGGVFPATHKESTRRKPISNLDLIPAQVVIPLVMCSDGCSDPIVHPGDHVTVGQLIAVQGERGGAATHASVSGRVIAIEDRPHPWGGLSPAIVIQNDERGTPCPAPLPPLPPAEITAEALLDRIRAAGIAGMGGGAYPTWDKLSRAMGRVDTLIINAAECEPYVTADHRLLLEHHDQIIRCSNMLSRCLGVSRAILVTEGDKLNAVELLERRLRKRAGVVELCTVRTRYPLGAEKQIVQTATGREVPPGKTPIDVKCVVLNLATVFAIWEAVKDGAPLTHRVLTVSGGAVERPRNLRVPIGTPLRCLLEDCGGLREDSCLMLLGGPMMGTPVQDPEAPVIKNTNSLICLADWERKKQTQESVCIRCGKCVSACPMHLVPTLIRKALQQGEFSRLDILHAADCNGCGCCSFICPANIPLVEQMLQAKSLVGKGGEAE